MVWRRVRQLRQRGRSADEWPWIHLQVRVLEILLFCVSDLDTMIMMDRIRRFSGTKQCGLCGGKWVWTEHARRDCNRCGEWTQEGCQESTQESQTIVYRAS